MDSVAASQLLCMFSQCLCRFPLGSPFFFNVPVIGSRSITTLTRIKWLTKMNESAPPVTVPLIYSRGGSHGKTLPVARKDKNEGQCIAMVLIMGAQEKAFSTRSIKADVYYVI